MAARKFVLRRKQPAMKPVQIQEMETIEFWVNGNQVNRIRKPVGIETEKAIKAFYEVFGLQGKHYIIRQSKMNYHLLTKLEDHE